MPQACEEDRDIARILFGSIDSYGPEHFLKTRGWTLHDDWTWSHPNHTWDENLPFEALFMICFLQDEWDYGSVRDKV